LTKEHAVLCYAYASSLRMQENPVRSPASCKQTKLLIMRLIILLCLRKYPEVVKGKLHDQKVSKAKTIIHNLTPSSSIVKLSGFAGRYSHYFVASFKLVHIKRIIWTVLTWS